MENVKKYKKKYLKYKEKYGSANSKPYKIYFLIKLENPNKYITIEKLTMQELKTPYKDLENGWYINFENDGSTLTNLFESDKKKVEFFSKIKHTYEELIITNELKKETCYGYKKILNKDDKVYIIGDIHSSIHSFREILEKYKRLKVINNNFEITNKRNYIIFLGDLVDRGPYSLEVLAIALQLKLINPDNVFIINGNHEDRSTYDLFGLNGVSFRYNTFIKKGEMFNELENNEIKKNIHTILECLPTVIFLKFENDNKWYQLCHGGIDPTFEPISYFDLPNNYFTINNLNYEKNGLKWSDFSLEAEVIKPSLRGAGYIYGIPDTKKYLNDNNLHSIISGHQDTVPLGILPKIQPANNNFNLYNNNAYKDILFTLNNDADDFFLLDPKKDFLALVTSTAVQSKDVKNNTYLVLYNKNKEDMLIVHSWK